MQTANHQEELAHTTITLQFRRPDHAVSVPAEVAGDWAIHATCYWEDTRFVSFPEMLTVSHVPTGRAIHTGWDRAQAEQVVLWLAAMDWDGWDFDRFTPWRMQEFERRVRRALGKETTDVSKT